MEELITSIATQLKDYREEESTRLFGVDYTVSDNRIRLWINQFDESVRIPILTELNNIFDKRYASKEGVKDFLKGGIEFLAKYLNYNSVLDFLDNSTFLHLQPDNKSQSILLNLLRDVLTDQFNYDFETTGNKSETNFIYIDDILCTGNTLFNNISEWINSSGELDELKKGNKKLVLLYIFIHSKNYYKKMAQFGHRIDSSFRNFTKMIRAVEIDNKEDGKMDLVKPINTNLSQLVNDYKDEIDERATNRANQNGYTPYPSEFFRDANIPINENFYTNSQNRIIFENAILEKGIEILRGVNNVNMLNMRALGYSLPSYKDFGFGTLAFTWRSVPNNSPLVFWYETRDFMPLFQRRSTW